MITALSGRGLRVRPLAADNQSLGGVEPWSREVAVEPYVVAVAYDNGRFGTVALDFDAKLGGPGDAATDADLMMRLLDTAGIPAVLARSGPTGGRHVFVAVAGVGLRLDTARTLIDRLIALGINTLDPSCMSSPQTTIRPPGAPHRHGGWSVVVGNPGAALDRLRRGHPNAPREGDLREFIDALAGPGDMRTPLSRPGVPANIKCEEKTFASGSELLQSYTTKVVACGGGVVELRAFVATLPASDDAARHLDKKSPKARESALVRSVRSAQGWLAENPTSYQGQVDDEAVLASWHTYDLVALDAPMGPVLVALLSSAQKYEQRLVGMSTRRLSEASGVSEPGARRGLKLAVEAQMLEVADAGLGRRAHRYRLSPPERWDAAVRDAVGHSPVKGGVSMPTASTSADDATALAQKAGEEIWHTQALGQKARVVYLHLARLSTTGDPVSTAAVSECVGKGVRQVRDDLTLLAKHGLARDLGRAGWVSEYRDPREITNTLGVTGIADELLRRHARQRRDYAVEIIEHRLRRKFGTRGSQGDLHVFSGGSEEVESIPAGGHAGRTYRSRSVACSTPIAASTAA